MKYLLAVVFSLVCFAARSPAASSVTISEFMASNSHTLADEDGAYEDWIEIRNGGTTDVNLLDWSLTDSAGNLTKWRFPATNFSAGAYMVVFASGKNRRIAGAPLHTSFKLSAASGFLALVEPDGVTLATAFSPTYPPQLPDVSYGFGLLSSENLLIATAAPARVLVPTIANGGNLLDTTWTGTDRAFDDSSWLSGVTGVGFGNGATLVASTSLVARFDFAAAPAANVIVDSKPSGTAHNGLNAGATWVPTSTDGATPPRTRTGVMQFTAAAANQIVIPASPDFNGSRGTIAFWMRAGGTTGAGNFGAMLVDRRTTSGDVIVLEDNGKIFVQANNGSTVNQFDSISSVTDNQWHHIAYVYDQRSGGGTAIYIDGRLDRTNATTAAWSWPASQQLEIGKSHDPYWRIYNGSLDDLRIYNRALTVPEIAQVFGGDAGLAPGDIGLNLQSALAGVNASAFLRVPFVVTAPTNISLLRLRLRYDDGFVAWINGVEVARANAPTTVAWNSAATDMHSAGLPDTFVLANPTEVLLPGTNMLAVQGLNIGIDDSSFFLLPELSATTFSAENTNASYFTAPTPGSANAAGATVPGPIISGVGHLPNVPLDSEDLLVTARVVPSFFAVSNVVLVYRIMYAPEISVPMFDDGGHGDGLAGDGIFGARIPADASTNGQMIRYAIAATDVRTNAARWPLYTDPNATAQYLGTIVDPTHVTSQLPVVHLFIDPLNQANADVTTGTRAALFFDGEFYDNIEIHVRGNTTAQASYLKRSHHLNFNHEHKFRYDNAAARLGESSLLAEFIDPAYLRQFLSMWLMHEAGVNAPFHYPVRVQNNGVFYQLAFHSDVLGTDQLSRFGLDPDGALYKACGVVDAAFESTGGFQKKTRLTEDRSDYLALANAIAPTVPVAQRRTNLFDMVDLPEVINYMAGTRITSEEDDVWANMSLYRDSNGTREWRIIPFDLNLSWGQMYGITTIQATNDAFKNNPSYGNSQCVQAGGPFGGFNRLYDSIMQVPETRQMLLRRLRTLMDEILQPPGTPAASGRIEQEITVMTNLFWNEAFLDRQKWQWPPNGAPYNWGPGIWLTNAVPDLVNLYVNPRRSHLYRRHSITDTALTVGLGNANNAGIPLPQPPNVAVQVAAVEFLPASGNPLEEYVCVTNPAPFALDLSRWKLTGAVQFTFKPGTVLPSNGVLYVSPDVNSFRARATGPRGGQALFVQGPYQGTLSARGETLMIQDATGRLVSTYSYPGAPSAPQDALRITEIMYHPEPAPGSAFGAEDFEYLKLKNISTNATLSLAGIRLVTGVTFDFTGSAITSLAPGATVLVVKSNAAFAARYGNALPVAGEYGGQLGNGGERLRLIDARGEEILDFTYDNAWYPITDGLGFSLVVVAEQAIPEAWNSATNWRPSGQLEGSPGTDDIAVAHPAVVLNEALTRNDATPGNDYVELLNTTASDVNVGGWFLSDDIQVPKKFIIPPGTVLRSHSYLAYSATVFNALPGLPGNFALNPLGGEVWLFSGDGVHLTGYLHGFRFGGADDGVPFGRTLSSDGVEQFVAQQSGSRGAPNAGPRIGPILFSEIQFHPPELADGSDNTRDEFIELWNISAGPVPLFDPAAPTNTWSVGGGVSFRFPANLTLAPGTLVLLVNFDPAADAATAAAFRGRYGVPAGVNLYGPYGGKLNNASDTLELWKPVLIPTGSPRSNAVANVLVEAVSYQSGAPWPEGASGTGLSLQRRGNLSFGNDRESWTAAPPNAGRPTALGDRPPTLQVQPTSVTTVAGQGVVFQVQASGAPPLRYQWQFRGTNVPDATNASLVLNPTQTENAGTYQVVIYNNGGAAVSSPVTLTLNYPAFVLAQPQSASVRPSNSVSFTVLAYSPSPIQYQWQFQGQPIAGATNATYSLPSVDLRNAGTYQVVLTDAVGSSLSAPATLTLLINPLILQQPLSVDVVQGGSTTLSVQISNTVTRPLGFRWRRNGVTQSFQVLDSYTSLFVVTNVQTNASFTVVVTNAANVNGILSATANVNMVADSDHDGIPDSVETALGLDPNNPADAAADLDGDGVSNLAEYIAGTDPKDPLSFLRMDPPQVDGGTTLHFRGYAGRTYTIQSSDGLAGGWATLANVAARSTNFSVEVVDPGAAPTRFYRVAAPAQP